MSKKYLTITFSDSFGGITVNMMGLLSSVDLEFLFEDIRSAVECKYHEKEFKLLLDANGFAPEDSEVEELFIDFMNSPFLHERCSAIAVVHHSFDFSIDLTTGSSELFTTKSFEEARQWLEGNYIL